MELHKVVTKIQEHMWLGNGDQDYIMMYAVARAFQVQSILEIGTHQGASAITFCEAILDNGDTPHIITVDNWCGIPSQPQDEDYKIRMKARALGFMKEAGYDKYITMIEGDSAIVLPEVFEKIGNVDLCFIDGNHSPNYVLCDFKTCSKYSNLMLLHDCYETEYLTPIRSLGWTALSFPVRFRKVEGGNDKISGITLVIKDTRKYTKPLER